MSLLDALIKGLKVFHPKRKSKAQGHRTAFEPLEPRNLLAGNLMGSIYGTVYDDATDNGLTSDDGYISGVDVDLYRDGGDGVFQGNAAGDDTFVQSATSNTSGNYQFTNLALGTYFVHQEEATGYLTRPGSDTTRIEISEETLAEQGALIDGFSSAQNVDIVSIDGPVTYSSASAPTAVGAERDVQITLETPIGISGVDVSPNGDSQLAYHSFTSTIARRVITWDGSDGSAETLDAGGLDGVDLTIGGTNDGVILPIGQDHAGGQAFLRVYSDAQNWSEAVIDIPDRGGIDTLDHEISFDSFEVRAGSGADFSQVGAIQLEITELGSVDGLVGQIRAVQPGRFQANFANLRPLSLGDLVWFDVDNSGSYNSSSEIGIGGVTVNLLQDTDGSGNFTPGTDLQIASDVTNAFGKYEFDDLLPGDYVVQLDATNFDSGPLAGTVLSTPGAGDPDNNIDNDNNGIWRGANGVVTRAISLTAGSEPTNDADSSAYSNTTVDIGVALYDLVIEKSATTATVVAGGQITYSLLVTNNGPADVTGVTVIDTLPDQVSFVSASASQGNTGHGGGTVTASLGDLDNGESATVTIIASVSPDFEGVLENDAVVYGDPPAFLRGSINPQADPTTRIQLIETDANNNRDDVRTRTVTLADLEIVKTSAPEPVVAGETLNYELVVTNHGPSTATGVTVVDTLPDGVAFASANASQGNVQANGQSIIVDLGTLQDEESATISIVVDVDSSVSDALFNFATVTGDQDDPNPDNNEDDAINTVRSHIDLAIAKFDSKDPATAGKHLSYELIVSNDGPSTATGVTVVDTLPDGVVYRSATTQQGAVSHNSGTVTADLGTLAPGEETLVTIVVDIEPDVVGTIINTASVTGDQTETNLQNNQDDEPTLIRPIVDVAILKSDSHDPAVAGESMGYELIVTNNGPSTATDVTVVDQLPGEVVFDSATTSQGTVTHANGVATADIGTLAPGATTTITILVDIPADVAGTIINTASVSSNEQDSNPGNNQDDEPTLINPVIDLSITKSDSQDPVIAGTELSYSLIVTNHGPSEGTGVVVTDTLPSGVTYQQASSDQGTVTHANGIVTAQIGDLSPGETTTINIDVSVNADAFGILTNRAAVAGNETEQNLGNNVDVEVTGIRSEYDLAILKTDSPDPIFAGEQLTYTLVVTNNGPSDSTDVIVVDPLPSKVHYVSATTTQGTVFENNNVVTAQLGYLAAGQSETIVIETTVDPSAVGRIENVATVDGKPVGLVPGQIGALDTETNLDNNVDDQPTEIHALLSSIAGYVYVDFDDDGIRDPDDLGISGVVVKLTGVDVLGNDVQLTTKTAIDGSYLFTDLAAGSYTITEMQPAPFEDGKDTPGGISGSQQPLQYDVLDDVFANIALAGGVDATDFNFGELMVIPSKRDYIVSNTP